MDNIKTMYECAIELMKIDVTKSGYVKQFEDLYSKYGVDIVNSVRSDFRGSRLGI